MAEMRPLAPNADGPLRSEVPKLALGTLSRLGFAGKNCADYFFRRALACTAGRHGTYPQRRLQARPQARLSLTRVTHFVARLRLDFCAFP
jgi:hypothetical protein